MSIQHQFTFGSRQTFLPYASPKISAEKHSEITRQKRPHFQRSTVFFHKCRWPGLNRYELLVRGILSFVVNSAIHGKSRQFVVVYALKNHAFTGILELQSHFSSWNQGNRKNQKNGRFGRKVVETHAYRLVLGWKVGRKLVEAKTW